MPIYAENFTGHGGVLDFYEGNHRALFPKLTKSQFSFQMSDHLPLWVQVRTDIDKHQLDQIIQAER
jgi:hypothetical protein